jgi:hypothetical protein
MKPSNKRLDAIIGCVTVFTQRKKRKLSGKACNGPQESGADDFVREHIINNGEPLQ